ncbi:MAG TPA: hypothetical protein VME40_12485 [Caulobacteraceae bacterium]|nr:hypothetical protein [Caulobacteraceae bacterium]
MPRPLAFLVGAASALVLAFPVAWAAPGDNGGACFRLSDIGGSKLDGPSKLYVRVNGRRVFRIDFENPCDTADAYSLVLHPVSNNGMVCKAIELDVHVRDTHEACVPKTLTELTPDEVAALPAKVRP